MSSSGKKEEETMINQVPFSPRTLYKKIGRATKEKRKKKVSLFAFAWPSDRPKRLISPLLLLPVSLYSLHSKGNLFSLSFHLLHFIERRLFFRFSHTSAWRNDCRTYSAPRWSSIKFNRQSHKISATKKLAIFIRRAIYHPNFQFRIWLSVLPRKQVRNCKWSDIM